MSTEPENTERKPEPTEERGTFGDEGAGPESNGEEEQPTEEPTEEQPTEEEGGT